MKVITVPAPVIIELPKLEGQAIHTVKESRTIFQFLEECFSMNTLFSKGHVNALLYIKLNKILKESEEKTEIWFEDEDFKKVLASTAGASWLTAKINAAYIPFYDAVEQARTEVLATEKKPQAPTVAGQKPSA